MNREPNNDTTEVVRAAMLTPRYSWSDKNIVMFSILRYGSNCPKYVWAGMLAFFAPRRLWLMWIRKVSCLDWTLL